MAARLGARLRAPVAGSRWLFPHLLSHRLAKPGPDEPWRLVSSLDAQWFFGGKLVFWIDPAVLTLRLLDRVEAEGREIWLSDRFVDAGDWTEVVRPIAQMAEHRDMLQLVRFGERYPEMPVFSDLAGRIRRGDPASRYGKRLDSEEKLHAYFRYFLQLAENIRRQGFLEQGQLAAGRREGVEVRGRWAGRQRNIGAALAADGSVLRFLGGRHRTAIAQALCVPAVPMEIRLVHREWLLAQVDSTQTSPVDALLNWVEQRRVADP